MNIRRIKALRNFIATLPPRAVYMPSYVVLDREGETVQEASRHTCGTRGCIAGWTVLRFMPNRDKAKFTGLDPVCQFNENGDAVVTQLQSMRVGRKFISTVARQLLGLSKKEAAELFSGKWRGSYVDLGKQTKRDVLRELDHIIKTGEI